MFRDWRVTYVSDLENYTFNNELWLDKNHCSCSKDKLLYGTQDTIMLIRHPPCCTAVYKNTLGFNMTEVNVRVETTQGKGNMIWTKHTWGSASCQRKTSKQTPKSKHSLVSDDL